MFIDHVAFVVSSLEQALETIAESASDVGPIEAFPAEGTRECYVGGTHHSAKLLLLEAISDGPYASALKRRGPGLHHIGVDVPDIDALLDTLDGTGWYLHPKSFRTRKAASTVWLARPGVGTLVEVHERPARTATPLLEAVRVAGLEARQASIFDNTKVRVTYGSPSAAQLAGRWFSLA